MEAAVASDAELIRSAVHDPSAFRELYDRYAERVHRFFARRTSDAEVALELTAETFAQAWVSRRNFRDLAAGSAAPWLFTIARRVLLASVARQRVERTTLERLRVDWRPGQEADVEPNEHWLDGLEVDLANAIDELPAGRRRAVELRVINGVPYDHIAVQLSCSPTAARIRVSRGLAQLRARLEGSHG
jgi:RNA polymerase sigma-70 factor (ECF subfamily)